MSLEDTLHELAALWTQEARASRERFIEARERSTLAERVARGSALDQLEVVEMEAATGGRTLLWVTSSHVDVRDLRASTGSPVLLWREDPDGDDTVSAILSRRRQDRLGLMIDGLQGVVQGLVEVHQHQHTDFHGDSGQGDKTNGNSHGQIVAQQVHQPDAANHTERQGAHYNTHLGHVAEIQVQQDHDNRQRQRYHQCQALLGTLHVLILAGPGQGVAGRQVHLLPHHRLSLFDPTTKIPACNVHQGPAIEAGIFRFDHGRPPVDPDIRHVGQRDTLSTGRHYGQ